MFHLSSRGRLARPLAILVALTLATAAAACGGTSSATSGAGGTTSVTAAAPSANAPARYTGPESELPNAYPTPTRKPGHRFKVGFLNPLGSLDILSALQKAAVAQVKALGGTTIVLDDQGDVNKQITDFDQLLAQKVDAILVYPLDPKSLGPSLAKARAKGVPVVGFDAFDVSDPSSPARAKEVPLPGFAAQIWWGRDHQAFLQAQQMARANPDGKVGLIGYGAPVAAYTFLIDRQRYWAQRFGVDVVGSQNTVGPAGDQAAGQSVGSTLLGQFPDMDGIIGLNDDVTLGALAAARGSGRDIVGVGMNGSTPALQAVKAGRLAATGQTDVVGSSVQAVRAAYDLLTKQHLPLAKVILRPPRLVNKQTVDQVATWDQQVAAIR